MVRFSSLRTDDNLDKITKGGEKMTSTFALKPRFHPSEMVAEMGFNDLKGLRVLFINMPLRESAKPNTPPEGPLLMAARLRQYGAEVSLIDLNAYRVEAAEWPPFGRHLTPEEAAKLIEAHANHHGEPDIIALSGMITTLRWQDKIAKICRQLMPDSFIISGGGLGTEIKSGLFAWIPELDALGDSEGDDIILILGQDILRRKMGLSEQPHPFVTQTAGGLIYQGNRPRDLDILPFGALDLLDEDVFGNRLLEEYIQTPVWGMAANNSSAAPFTMTRSLTTVSSRGCPYGCAFCYRGAQGERNWGTRSGAHLRRHAEELIARYGIDFLGFPDDNFAVNPKRIEDVKNAFGDLGLRWGTHTRMDEADDRIFPMRESGCVYIGFGAESASADILERMNKGGFILRPRGTKENQLTNWNGFNFPTTMVQAIKNCRQTGIHGNCTWIMSYPGETLHDLKISVAFILWQHEELTRGLDPASVEYQIAASAVNRKMFTATAYPGTAMFKEPRVRELLTTHFGLSFDQTNQPIVDRALRSYVEELDDATKVLHGTDGMPLNFGDMSLDQFLEARSHLDSGQIEKILDMS